MVDELYASVVFEAQQWDEAAFAEWHEALAASVGPVGKQAASQVRRALRAAMKLQAFWASIEAERYTSERDWRVRVDVALGARAWRPTLELARMALEADADAETFALVQERFRLVNNQPWLPGVSYESWAEGSDRPTA